MKEYTIQVTDFVDALIRKFIPNPRQWIKAQLHRELFKQAALFMRRRTAYQPQHFSREQLLRRVAQYHNVNTVPPDDSDLERVRINPFK